MYVFLRWDCMDGFVSCGFFDVTGGSGQGKGDGEVILAGMISKMGVNYVSHLKSLIGGLHGLVHGLVD